jgi:hypothetical protein
MEYGMSCIKRNVLSLRKDVRYAQYLHKNLTISQTLHVPLTLVLIHTSETFQLLRRVCWQITEPIAPPYVRKLPAWL